LVYTSSAMVFHHDPPGPHGIDKQPTAQDDYGRYKAACEAAIRGEYPAALLARIGWQIDPTQAGNNMLMALDQWQLRDGHVGASRLWLPACSFMEDTAEALLALAERRSSGVVHLDSNADEGHSFVQVVKALQQRFERQAWLVSEHEDYRHDQRLIGSADWMPPLSDRLPL
ncbi:MAG: sugar nucleotide-binding protein, partial [Rhizobacter sp.]